MGGQKEQLDRSEDQVVREEIDSLFTNIFLLSLKLENISNRILQKDDLTIKQFLLIAAIDSFEAPPSIKEVAEKTSTTHQSVKEIANRLDRRGFILIEKDPNDKRILRLSTTQKNWDYWESRLSEHENLIFKMFEPFSDDEIHHFNEYVNRFVGHLQLNFKVR